MWITPNLSPFYLDSLGLIGKAGKVMFIIIAIWLNVVGVLGVLGLIGIVWGLITMEKENKGNE